MIKIITLHCPLNYGAALQAYALKTYLRAIGQDAELIDYRPDYIVDKQKYTYVGKKSIAKNVIAKCAYIFAKFPSRYKIKHNFSIFMKKELCKGDNIYRSIEDLRRDIPQADVFFTGSDQIWNTQMENGWDDAYFLSFVSKGKKCSYAASMAKSSVLTSEEEQRFKQKLEDFDMISVREENAKNILQPLVRQEIRWVLDPVFLLSESKWKMMADKAEEKVTEQKYILIYPMGDGLNVISTAQKLSKETGLPIYSISKTIRSQGVTRQFNGYTPYEFLHLIQNAQYVVTNSFHGTSFSIIFKKNFWACSIGNTSSRITSLLQSLDLSHRFLLDGEEKDSFTETIDYGKTYKKLEERLLYSKSYIDSCINENINENEI